MTPRSTVQNEEMRTATLEKITKASLRVFSELGYHGTTMKKIAKEVELSYGLVYHYFPSKEKLFFHLVDVALDKSNGTLSRGVSIEGSAMEKISNLSRVLIEELLSGDSHQYFFIILQAMTEGKGVEGLLLHIKERSAAHYGYLLPLIIEAQQQGEVKAGEPALLAASYFSLFQGLSLLVFQEERMDESLSNCFTPAMLTDILKPVRD